MGSELNDRKWKPSLTTILSGWDKATGNKVLRSVLPIHEVGGEQIVEEGVKDSKLEGRSVQEGRHLNGCQGGQGCVLSHGSLCGFSGSCHLGIGLSEPSQLVPFCQIKVIQFLQNILALTQRGLGLGLGGIGGLGCSPYGGIVGLDALCGLGTLPGGLGSAGWVLLGGQGGFSGGIVGGTGTGGDHHHGGHDDAGPAEGYGNEFGGFDGGHRRSASFNFTTNEDLKRYEHGDRGQGVKGDLDWWHPHQGQVGERR